MSELCKTVILLVWIITAGSVHSQEQSPDPRISEADSLLEAGQYDLARKIYESEYFSLEKSKDREKTLAELSNNIGLCCFQQDNYQEAIDWFTKSAGFYKHIGDMESHASALNNIGLNYKILGNYEKAIAFYEETLKIDEELGDKKETAKTYNNIGMIYRAWGKYDKAIEYMERSYNIKKETGDIPAMSISLNNIGLVYSEWKKYDQAIDFIRESLAIEISRNSENDIAKRLNNLGRVFFYKQKYDSAKYYFEKSLPISIKNNDSDQIALISNNLGKVYLELKDFVKASEYFSTALRIYSELGMISEKSTVLANLGFAYQAQGKYPEALHMLDSSTAIAERLQITNQVKQNYLNYSDMFSETRDFEKSLFYYKKYTALKDTIFTKEIESQLSEFQVKYEKEKDRAQILKLEKENLRKTNQRNGYMFTGIGIIALALFNFAYFRQKARHTRQIAEQKIRQLEEEKKLMAAKLIVEGQEEERKRIATELHDGLGVLLSATKMQFSVIKAKSPENRELIDKATQMLEQATGDVRKISHNMMPGLLTKLGFFEAVEDLFEHIADTRQMNATCTISGIKERFAENKEIMLYRIIQEMVNNTLKYAAAKNIDLKIKINPGLLEMDFSDDGKGFDKAKIEESTSIGLKSILSRVDFLSGSIDIVTSPGKGVTYSLQIPV